MFKLTGLFFAFRVPSELRWLSRQIRPFIGWHVVSFLCVTAGSLLALFTPLVLKWLIDQVLPQRQSGMLLAASLLILLSYQGRSAFSSIGNYLTLNAVQRMAFRLRIELLEHLDILSADYYESAPPGRTMYALSEPIEEVAYFGSDLVPAILRMCLTTGFTVVTMLILSPSMTFAVLPLIPAFLAIRQHLRTKLSTRSDDVQRKVMEWTSFLEEHFSSILPIQLLGREKHQERKAFRILAEMTRSYLALFRTGVWFTAYTSLAVVIAMSTVVGYGGWRALTGRMSVGTLVAFYSFVTQLFEPLSGAAELYARTQKTFASIRRLQSIWALRPSITESPSSVALPEEDWSLEFSGVEFAYAERQKLLSVPFLRICQGEEVAICGENGAGKSTFVKLIARVYDVNAGYIRVGGTDIREIQLKSLRKNACYLARDPVLFDGTLAQNLRFVKPNLSDRELHEILKLVQLDSLVRAQPEQLNQQVGPDGCRLSGGERQRLALARALLRSPRILMLDEASSCIDAASEVLILSNVRMYLPSATLIVISHRVSTFARFPRILEVSSGEILEGSAARNSASHSIAHAVEGAATASRIQQREPA